MEGPDHTGPTGQGREFVFQCFCRIVREGETWYKFLLKESIFLTDCCMENRLWWSLDSHSDDRWRPESVLTVVMMKRETKRFGDKPTWFPDIMDLSRGKSPRKWLEAFLLRNFRRWLLLTEMGMAAARAFGVGDISAFVSGPIREWSPCYASKWICRIGSQILCQDPQTTSRFHWFHWEDSTGLSYGSASCDLQQENDTTCRFKMPGTKSRRSRVQSSKRPLAVAHTGHGVWQHLNLPLKTIT